MAAAVRHVDSDKAAGNREALDRDIGAANSDGRLRRIRPEDLHDAEAVIGQDAPVAAEAGQTAGVRKGDVVSISATYEKWMSPDRMVIRNFSTNFQ